MFLKAKQGTRGWGRGRHSWPDRKGEVTLVLLAGPGQEAAVDSPGLQQGFGFQAGDVSVEPPVMHRRVELRLGCTVAVPRQATLCPFTVHSHGTCCWTLYWHIPAACSCSYARIKSTKDFFWCRWWYKLTKQNQYKNAQKIYNRNKTKIEIKGY